MSELKSIKRKDDNANLMTLNLESLSEESKAFINDIIGIIIPVCKRPNKRLLKEALAAICAELLEAAGNNHVKELYRPMGRSQYTGRDIGYRSFIHALAGLKAMDYIVHTPGFCPASIHDPNPPKASRLRARPKLIDLAATYGITPSNWNDHFKARPWDGTVKEPLVVKSASEWKGSFKSGKVRKVKGERMLYNPADPKALKIISEIEGINSFLAGHDIQPAHWFRGLQRIFANGDQPDFDWNKGGRLYAVDGGGYQQMDSETRSKITFNGERSAELDIRGSHLTIYHALLGNPLDWSVDPYAVPGVDRNIVKMFVTITLGKGKLARAWPKETKADYANAKGSAGRDLQTDHPIADVRAKVLAHLPLLADIASNSLAWADFQYRESQAVTETMRRLADEYDVPALPVHDSLILPMSAAGFGERLLKDSFNKYVGVEPGISFKNSGEADVP